MNDQSNTVSIQLGIEELLFLMGALRIKTLPGLGENAFAGLNRERGRHALTAGFHSLRARELVQENATAQQPLVIDSLVTAILGTCATAQQAFFIDRQPSDGAREVHYVHFGSHFIVRHSIEIPGVHRFTATIDVEEAFSQVHQALFLNTQVPPTTESISIAKPQLDQAMAAVREQRLNDAIDILVRNQVPAGLADTFVASVHEIQANSVLVKMKLGDEGEREAEGLFFLESTAGFWLVTSSPNGNNTLHSNIEPISAEESKQRIRALISNEDLSEKLRV